MPQIEEFDKYINELWLEMQDNYKENALRIEGALNMAVRMGLITSEKRELWQLRINKCPDPEHIGCRTWCAYCGDITVKE